MNKLLKIYFYISLLLLIFFFGFSSAYYKFFPYDLIIKPLGSISNFIISKKYKDQYMNYNDQELKVYNKFISLNLANLPFDFVLTLDMGSSNNDMFYLKKNNFFQKIPSIIIIPVNRKIINCPINGIRGPKPKYACASKEKSIKLINKILNFNMVIK